MQVTDFKPYRIPINAALLDATAQRFLEESKEPEKLLQSLGWGPDYAEYLASCIAPHRDPKEISGLIKQNEDRKALKVKRVAAGFPELHGPRKGLKGWWQRKFRDPKEQVLPDTYHILKRLTESPRYQLLVAIHDAILGHVSTAEPKRATKEQVATFPHPLAEVLVNKKKGDALAKLKDAMGKPLHDVPPQFVVDGLSGYVVVYQRMQGAAYYYAE